MKKVPSALKWLAEKRARVAGQLRASQQVHELVSAQVAALEKELTGLRAIQTRAAEKVAQRTRELAALDGSVVIYDDTIDPQSIGIINGWTGRYGKRGALREFLFATLQSRAPEYVPTPELALLCMAEFSLVFEHWKLRYHWYHQSLRNALQGLEKHGRIERAPTTPFANVEGNAVQGWRVKQEKQVTLAELYKSESLREGGAAHKE
jgi:hypothetical protein